MTPDVAIAEELITRVDVRSWPRRTEGLTNALPFLRYDDLEYYEELQAWLAARAGDRPSYTQAAIENLRRVLDDILLVVNFDMEPRGGALWVRKWYHGSRGGDSSPREVEYYETHCLLIHNLAAELTRAVNLVLTRAREADNRVHPTAPLATVDAGSADAPMHAARYSAEESALPQPYPGLRKFPELIMSRDIGALGERYHDHPREPEHVVAWIEEMLKRGDGPRPSGPPPTGDPPKTLSRRSDPTATTSPVAWWKHPIIITGLTVLSLVGYLNDATAKPWLTGVTLGVLLVALPGYKWLVRPRPPVWLLVGVVAVAAAGALVAEWVAGPSDKADADATSTDRTEARSTPETRADRKRSTGQIAGGDVLLASADLRSSTDLLSARIGLPFYLIFFLDNVGPDTISAVRVQLKLPEQAERAPAIAGVASSPDSNPSSVRDTVSVRFVKGAACLRVVPNSTSLRLAGGSTLQRFGEGVTSDGVTVGPLDVQGSGRPYVAVRLVPRKQPAGSRCE